MSNQSNAAEALARAREQSKTFKSSNKYFDERIHPAKFKRRYESSLYRGAIEKDAPTRGASMEDIVGYADKVINVAKGAANCGELSALACAYLSHAGVELFDYVILQAPGDHAFVAIGQTAPANGVYPFSFADWDDDAWICDPWVNLTCAANVYPTQWRAKMTHWQEVGKRLGKPGDEYLGQFEVVDATDPYWLNGLTDCNKLSLTHQPLAAPAQHNARCCVLL